MRVIAAALVTAATVACAPRAGSGPAAPAPAARASASAEPATLRYAAGAGRYRLESASLFAQEVMGNPQERRLTQSMVLATTLTEDAGNLALSATVESLTVAGDAPGVSAGALDSSLGVVRGRTFHSVFTPAGRSVASSVPDSANPVVVQVGRLFREFLPRLPAATAAGTTWVDTVNDTQTIPGGAGQMSTQSIRESRVVGWETRDGVRALHIAVNGRFTIAGTGDIQGQPIELSGSGQATADRWISTGGVFLAGVTNDSTNLTVNVLNVGMSIPVRQVQRLTITRLP